MKRDRAELELHVEAAPGKRASACQKACLYLLQKYIEGCEEIEGICIYEGFNGGTGRKGLFNASTEK